MIKLRRNSIFFLLACVFSLMGCNDKKQFWNSSLEGFQNSAIYKKSFMEGENSNDYNMKRMFTLLGEESFLYNSDYRFYAVYLYLDNDTNDFYVIKSKGSFVTATHKRLIDRVPLFSVEETQSGIAKNKVYDLEVKTQMLDLVGETDFSDMFKKVISLLNHSKKYTRAYHSPTRGLCLFYDRKYYIVSDIELEGNVMDEVDSLFRFSNVFN